MELNIVTQNSEIWKKKKTAHLKSKIQKLGTQMDRKRKNETWIIGTQERNRRKKSKN